MKSLLVLRGKNNLLAMSLPIAFFKILFNFIYKFVFRIFNEMFIKHEIHINYFGIKYCVST